MILKLIKKRLFLEHQFVWKSTWTSKGHYTFADDCEFHGGDYDVIEGDASHIMCRDNCLLDPNCTHITVINERGRKTCFTKTTPNPGMKFILTHEKGSICGYFGSPKTI